MNEDVKLTVAEIDVLENLAQAWNSFIGLDQEDTHHLNDFKDAIHTCERLIALRVAKRVDPRIWR